MDLTGQAELMLTQQLMIGARGCIALKVLVRFFVFSGSMAEGLPSPNHLQQCLPLRVAET